MDIINEDLDIPTPAQHQPASNTIINSDFLKFVMNVENAELKGRDPKTKIWHPHSSPEGGSETVGYGHKLKNGPNVQKHTNLSDKDVVKLLRDDLVEANKKVHQYVEKVYGIKILLNQKQEEMLTEFVFNLGGLDKFPKFTEAVLKNDMPTMRKEYKRFYRGKDQKPIELERRNKLFYDRFLK
jgi:GH24 family phage-related lysozyme (muramidase)